ncbi:uncharacterized protein LOC118458370 isoform X2 [Anopheles albimanus]|uniref:uncharacterized protein LOC118458370 isoform X2 n=1 Tax=Anopheles albimanus TaxID=7167 RepID=UPI001640219B|nr:uncharacterized protein LOC118458370 isoform X2 [Anopheles albimanus]
MKRTPLGGHMASQHQHQVYHRQQHYQFQHERNIRRKLKPASLQQETAKHQASSPTQKSCATVNCSLISTSNSSSNRSSSSISSSSSSHSSISSNKPSSPSSIYSSTSSISSSSSASPASGGQPEAASATSSSNTGMHRHRKKDRLDRSAAAAAAPKNMYSGSTTSPPLTPISNENLYQPCFGGTGSVPPAVREQPEPPAPPSTASDDGCCHLIPTQQQHHRMHNLAHPSSLPTSCYPEADPDSIEVFRDQQQHNPDLHVSAADDRHVPRHLFSKWSGGLVNSQDSTGAAAAAVAAVHSQSSSSAGAAEYSYAYCEPILLQRAPPVPVSQHQHQQEGATTLLETVAGSGGAGVQPAHSPPPPSLSSSGSSYCVPMYAQQQQQQLRRTTTIHHQHQPPLPSLKSTGLPPSTVFHHGLRTHQHQHQQQQQHYQCHPATAQHMTTHHHHHHHHHNYTLPGGGAGSGSKPVATGASTTTGSLRALFTNIFRKSSASTSPSSSRGLAVAAARVPGTSDSMMGGSSLGPLPLMPFMAGAGPGSDETTLGGPTTERHSFTTCYGTKENIYEDIGSQSGFASLTLAGPPTAVRSKPPPASGGAAADDAATVVPTGETTCPDEVKPVDPPASREATEPTRDLSAIACEPTAGGFNLSAEWRQVQLQHERIIGELNLSVERLIMPSYDEQQQQQQQFSDQLERIDEDAGRMHLGEVLIHAPPLSLSGGSCTNLGAYCGASSVIGGDPADAKPGPGGSINHSRRRHGGGGAHVMQLSIASSSPQQPTMQTERHSPTISYGKSYGDVDSGISSSSTSGTSYSSSILYRSITNYQQHAGGGGGVGPANKDTGQQQQHGGRKPILFGLRISGNNTGGLFTSPSSSTSLSMATMLARGGGRATSASTGSSCRSHHGMMISGGVTGETGATTTTSPVRSVTNAPDPPPPPDDADELLPDSRRCPDTCCATAADVCDLQFAHQSLHHQHHHPLYALHAPAMERYNTDTRLLSTTYHQHTTSRHRAALATCCFFPEANTNQQQQQRAAWPAPGARLERLSASTPTYNGGVTTNNNTTTGGNFWNRFRKLRQTATGLFGNANELSSVVGADERFAEVVDDGHHRHHQLQQQRFASSGWTGPLSAPRPTTGFAHQQYQQLHQQQQYHHQHYHHLSPQQQQQQQYEHEHGGHQFSSSTAPSLALCLQGPQPIVGVDDGVMTASTTAQTVEQKQQQQQPQRIQSCSAPTASAGGGGGGGGGGEQQALRSRSPSSSRSSSSPSTITSASATPSSPSSPVSSTSSTAKMSGGRPPNLTSNHA